MIWYKLFLIFKIKILSLLETFVLHYKILHNQNSAITVQISLLLILKMTSDFILCSRNCYLFGNVVYVDTKKVLANADILLLAFYTDATEDTMMFLLGPRKCTHPITGPPDIHFLL